MRLPLFRSLACCAIALISAGTPAQESLFEALSGPEGGGVSLQTGARRDGTPGNQEMQTSPDGSIATFRADGRTTLRSPRINLDADGLLYDHTNRLITATGNVVVDQEGVKATCGKLVYRLATAELVLTETPIVEQRSEKDTSRFTGMETFLLTKDEKGAMRITLSGGEQILMEMLPPPPGSATPSPTPSPTPVVTGQAGDAAPKSNAARGLASFGNNVRISTRPLNEVAPSVVIDALPGGVFDKMQALGSVLVESDDMRLRADELIYNGPEQRIDARRNVYIKQQNIEADAQAMKYELASGLIELTGKPEIRDQRPNGLYKISQLAAYIITRAEDGTISTKSVAGPDGPIATEFIPDPVAAKNEVKATPTDEGEISLDNADDIRRLGPAPTPAPR
jgi:lipopolysaccharide export system protein LptA